MKERISEVPLNATPTPPTSVKPFVEDMTDDQLRKLAREQLSKALQAVDAVESPEMTRKLCAELMDRLDGKPGQAITMDANLNVVNVHASIEFVRSRVAILENSPVDKVQVIDN